MNLQFVREVAYLTTFQSKIKAIKHVRAHMGTGLKESKDFVDALAMGAPLPALSFDGMAAYPAWSPHFDVPESFETPQCVFASPAFSPVVPEGDLVERLRACAFKHGAVLSPDLLAALAQEAAK